MVDTNASPLFTFIVTFFTLRILAHTKLFIRYKYNYKYIINMYNMFLQLALQRHLGKTLGPPPRMAEPLALCFRAKDQDGEVQK